MRRWSWRAFFAFKRYFLAKNKNEYKPHINLKGYDKATREKIERLLKKYVFSDKMIDSLQKHGSTSLNEWDES